MRAINKIVVHCSDSPDTRDIGAKEITEWHIARGFDTIGYHYVVRRNGTVEYGRPEEHIGAHVEGHNKDSVGICWVGRDRPSVAQREALIALINRVRGSYNLPPSKVFGHKEFNPGKTCPNLDMDALRGELK